MSFGAVDMADALIGGGAIWGGVAVSLASSAGGSGAAVLAAGIIGIIAGTGLLGAGAFGYATGIWLNDHTPIQSWISSGFVSMGMGA